MDPDGRYGRLERPEHKAHIEVVEDPVRAACAAYTIWQGGIKDDDRFLPASHNCSHIFDKAGTEQLYREAARLLAPRAELFTHVHRKDLETILAHVAVRPQDDKPGESGVFLSALLNVTGLPALEGIFRSRILGYRLAPGKRLVVQRGSHICDLGRFAEGELLNHGKAYALAWNARGGVQANYGTASYLAYYARGGAQLNYRCNTSLMAGVGVTGGIQANFKEVQQSFAAGASGIQLNYGKVRLGMAPGARAGVQANLGHAGSMGFHASGGLQVQWGTLDDAGVINGEGPDFTRKLPRGLRPALELRRKLRAFKRTVGTGDPAVLHIYDFNGFEADVLRLGRDITEALR
jgi:hypothetical protein